MVSVSPCAEYQDSRDSDLTSLLFAFLTLLVYLWKRQEMSSLKLAFVLVICKTGQLYSSQYFYCLTYCFSCFITVLSNVDCYRKNSCFNTVCEMNTRGCVHITFRGNLCSGARVD